MMTREEWKVIWSVAQRSIIREFPDTVLEALRDWIHEFLPVMARERVSEVLL